MDQSYHFRQYVGDVHCHVFRHQLAYINRDVERDLQPNHLRHFQPNVVADIVAEHHSVNNANIYRHVVSNEFANDVPFVDPNQYANKQRDHYCHHQRYIECIHDCHHQPEQLTIYDSHILCNHLSVFHSNDFAVKQRYKQRYNKCFQQCYQLSIHECQHITIEYRNIHTQWDRVIHPNIHCKYKCNKFGDNFTV